MNSSEIYKIEQALNSLLEKLLTAVNTEDCCSILESISPQSSTLDTIDYLLREINDGKEAFNNKVYELGYDNHYDDLNAFKEGLTLQAHEVFGSLPQDICHPVTWGLIENIEKALFKTLGHLKKADNKQKRFSKFEGLDLTVQQDSKSTHIRKNEVTQEAPPLGDTDTINLLHPPTVPSPEIIQTLADLFINPEDVEICVAALRTFRIDRPLIDENNQWQNRKRSKEILAAWLRWMENSNKVRFIRPLTTWIPLLNDFFPGLNFGEYARTLKDPDQSLIDEFKTLNLP